LSRSALVRRTTREVEVELTLDLDGSGGGDLDTGVPVLDHLLDQLRRHGLFDLSIKARGDLAIDAHHTTEDVGLALGTALAEALGERRGVRRYAHAYAPLDEALAFCCVDLSGRPYLAFEAPFDNGVHMGNFPLELVEEFFRALCSTSRTTWHLRSVAGRNLHHRAESLFKAAALALRGACEIDPRRGAEIPSTKGLL
jgi:imidazoleglycerol-phosphate dehydratase